MKEGMKEEMVEEMDEEVKDEVEKEGEVEEEREGVEEEEYLEHIDSGILRASLARRPLELLGREVHLHRQITLGHRLAWKVLKTSKTKLVQQIKKYC